MSDSVREKIVELRLAAESTPIEVPQLRSDLLNEADDLEWREQYYLEKVDKVLAIANPRYEAYLTRRSELRRLNESGDIDYRQERELRVLERQHIDAPRDSLELSRYFDREQRLFHWCAELKLIGFLTPAEESAIGAYIGDSPRRLAEIKQNQAELERLKKLRDEVLATIPPGWPRREALTCWNILGGHMDENKHERWVEALRTRKLLNNEWLPQRVMGALFRRLLHGKEKIENGIFFK